MNARLLAAGLLAMVGGLLMILSGYVSRGFLFLAMGYAQSEIPAFLTGLAAGAAYLAFSILELIIALGGVTIIFAGILMVSGHARSGRALIFLGGGAGFLGLLASFGFTVYGLGISKTLTFAPYWVGLIFAVIARRIAKGA